MSSLFCGCSVGKATVTYPGSSTSLMDRLGGNIRLFSGYVISSGYIPRFFFLTH